MTDLDTTSAVPIAAPTEGWLPQLRELAAAYTARVEKEREEEEREQLRSQRAQESADRQCAAARAAEYVEYCFPETLARVLPAEDWVGYPQLHVDVHGKRADKCAVAYLGDGLFLRYISRSRHADGYFDGYVDVMELIQPCACGNYIEHLDITDDDALSLVLADGAHSAQCVNACTPTYDPANPRPW
ncbi:hypothetical protein G5C51_08180 [Streptomyces sp. A7024]|uniref:Uncharacterized protein n=1 Tax=Streptomyces coryli TaxID=1128680 RepID=A0A6G4TVG5_9ACTN|nr:hypothetical protein [Streptomyces coryli]NGN63884.1 hypothetical protein [Streptomyces coryli]